MAADDRAEAVSYPLSRGHRTVLGLIHAEMQANNRWPSYAVVDFEADRRGVVDPLLILQPLAPTYVSGLAATGTPGPDDELYLTLTGLHAVSGWSTSAANDLELLSRSVTSAVAMADRTAVREVAIFKGVSFFTSTGERSPLVKDVIRLGLLWRACFQHGTHGISNAGQIEWQTVLHRQNLRNYRDVTSPVTLLEADRRRREKQEVADAQLTHGPDSSLGPTRGGAPSWIALLPDGFREAVETRLPAHGSDAINAGWVALAGLIHAKSGLDLDGAPLVNQSFGGPVPRVQLGDTSETGSNLHSGYTDMMRGLVRVRNAHSHRGRPETDELHVAAMLLAMGECYRAVGRAHAD